MIEGVDQTLAIVIEVLTRAHPDGGLVVRCIGEREARRYVVLRLGPKAGRAVVRSARGELQVGLVDLALQGSRLALCVPGMRIDSGRDLLAAGLIGRLQNRVAHAEGNSEVGACLPLILKVVFEFIRFEMPVDYRAVRKQRTSGGAGDLVVIHVCHIGNRSHQVGVTNLIGVLEAGIHRR